MNISAGLSGIKAAGDLTKMLREAVKAGSVSPSEILERVGHIYDYILDSKAALIDAKEENERLKAELKEAKDYQTLNASLEHDGKVYWLSKDGKWDGPFCSRCWDDGRKLIRLEHQRMRMDDSQDVSFWCPVDRTGITTRKRPMVISLQPPLK